MATTGKYPPSGGWERLIPEEIKPVPTPKPRPPLEARIAVQERDVLKKRVERELEWAARVLYEEATRPGSIHLHYQGPSPPWDKLSEKKKDRWRDQARITELERANVGLARQNAGLIRSNRTLERENEQLRQERDADWCKFVVLTKDEQIAELRRRWQLEEQRVADLENGLRALILCVEMDATSHPMSGGTRVAISGLRTLLEEK